MDTAALEEQAAMQAQAQAQAQQQQQQQYNSESDEEGYEVDGFSDDQALQQQQTGWIKWFCSLEGHEFLVEVDNEFIEDPFNLMGLQERYTKDKLRTCLRMILSPSQPNEEDLNDEGFLELNQESSDLYSLIHARFVLSPRGLAKVYQKFLNGVFGTCPRALCDRQKVLPVGLSDSLKTSRFKIFCPRCEEVYLPKTRQVNVDGACYGTSFPQVFQMHFPMAIILPPKIYHYEPKIFGFNIAGKRGSKYFDPPKGNVRYIESSVPGLEMEEIKRRYEPGSASTGNESQSAAASAAQMTIDFSKRLNLDAADNSAAKGAAAANSTGEDNEAIPSEANNRAGGGKKNRKKNKKQQ